MKTRAQKSIIIIAALLLSLLLAYGSPRDAYQSTGILKTIVLPDTIGQWKGEDVKQDLNLGQNQYFFIGDIKTKKYINPKGFIIFLTLLDEDNFHNPKNCFTGAGYTPQDLPDTDLESPQAQFKAATIFFKKPDGDILLIYWLCIDQHRINWTAQKLKEFWFTLSGKKKTGFTIRLDIPTTETNIKSAQSYAQDLVKHLSHALPKEKAEYIFGK